VAGKLDELVKALDTLDLAKVTVGDLKNVRNPILADAIRKLIDQSLVPGNVASGHTSHLNHLSHFNHLSHSSSSEEFPQGGPAAGGGGVVTRPGR
jgi:hypothetical protein